MTWWPYLKYLSPQKVSNCILNNNKNTTNWNEFFFCSCFVLRDWPSRLSLKDTYSTICILHCQQRTCLYTKADNLPYVNVSCLQVESGLFIGRTLQSKTRLNVICYKCCCNSIRHDWLNCFYLFFQSSVRPPSLIPWIANFQLTSKLMLTTTFSQAISQAWKKGVS